MKSGSISRRVLLKSSTAVASGLALSPAIIGRAEAADGTPGWGETYGIVAPLAVLAILRDVMIPIVEGRDPRDASAIYDELYDLMRVRGASGGYYGDALAAIDIALWDLAAKEAGVPLHQAIGTRRVDRVPAYVSGLPKATLDERVALAKDWQARGFGGVKFAAVSRLELRPARP